MSHKIASIALCFIHLFCGSSGYEEVSQPGKDDTYSTEKRLFHIERSKNKNIVCYDLNADAAGKPDEKQPLSVYWINREEHEGKREELNYIQQKMAYGYTVKGKRNGVIIIGLNAATDREITLERNEQKYFCRIDINRQSSVLTKLYIKTKTPNSLQVEYVEIEGTDLITGAPVKERFTP